MAESVNMTHAPLHLTHTGYRLERHGRWTTGRARAAVFGLSDGLVSNMSLIAGVAGASATRATVLVGGAAGLVAGAMSMAVGEYASMRANAELLQRELDTERREIETDPAGETRELAGIYVQRGLEHNDAMQLATLMMQDPDRALEAHAREELGVDPNELGSPVGASVSSFGAFAVGAALPLLPWLFAEGRAMIAVSLLIGLAAAAALGGVLGRLSGRGPWRSAARQVGLAGVAFAVTYLIGNAVGAAV
jgi:vacuolar iron transporter family protein